MNACSVSLFITLAIVYLFASFYLLQLHFVKSRQQRRLLSEVQKLLRAEADDKDTLQVKISANSSALYSQQRWRKQLIVDGCRSQSAERWSARKIKSAAKGFNSLIVDDKLRYIYCRVAKVASTSWCRVLLVATGKMKVTNPNKLSQGDTYACLRRGYPLRRLASYTPEEIEMRLKHYFKFMFVRHPLDRLVSAFNDRLKSHHVIPKRLYRRHVVRKYRRPNDVIHDKGVQFREFVRYIVDPATSNSGFNEHWRPHTNICMPCQIDYDFIGHYETLRDDAAVVLATINASSSLQYPTSDPDNRQHHYNTSQRLANMFGDVDQTDIHLLKNVVYANDFLLFGYQ